MALFISQQCGLLSVHVPQAFASHYASHRVIFVPQTLICEDNSVSPSECRATPVTRINDIHIVMRARTGIKRSGLYSATII